MKPVLILYATRHGHCARIAERVLASIRARALEAEAIDAAHVPSGFSLGDYSAAMLVSPVHLGRHEAAMTRFVKSNVERLEAIPAAFLSISLSQAGAEAFNASPEKRAQAAADAAAMIDGFLEETGWHPARIQAVAGALLYTKYNFLLRFVMKRIAGKAGASTDVSNDREYTDWPALDRFCGQFARELWDRAESSPGAPLLVHASGG
jgi:menaquinone-dependent protoporphyrinogen oxidase